MLRIYQSNNIIDFSLKTGFLYALHYKAGAFYFVVKTIKLQFLPTILYCRHPCREAILLILEV